jgi:transcriptional regulator with XRE-family HTH domain
MRAVREQRDMTRELVALRAGVTPGTVAAWELGRAVPYVWTFIAWAHAVGLAPSDAIARIEAYEDDGTLPRRHARRCAECKETMPVDAPLFRTFCSVQCRQTAFRARKRAGAA